MPRDPSESHSNRSRVLWSADKSCAAWSMLLQRARDYGSLFSTSNHSILLMVKERNWYLLLFVDHSMLRRCGGGAEAGLVDLLQTTIETATDAKRPFRKSCKQKPCSMKCRSILCFLIHAFAKSEGLWILFVDVYYLHLDESEVEQLFLGHFIDHYMLRLCDDEHEAKCVDR